MRIQSVVLFCAVVVSLFTTSAFAQDQTFIVPGTLAQTCDIGDGDLTVATAKTLIETALKAIEPDTAYIIHVVRYNRDSRVIKEQHWYMYDPDWTNVKGGAAVLKPGAGGSFTETRIFGRKRLGIVFAYDIGAVAQDTQNTRFRPAARYSALNALYYRIDISKKQPSNVSNLRGALALAVGAPEAAAETVVQKTLCGGTVVTTGHVPGDVAISARYKDGDDEKEVGKQTFDNEGRYWWDVSFALPVKSREDLTIDVEGGQIGAKKVEKTDLFAVFNVGLPRDTKKAQIQVIPTFVYGMPITGKPLNHHLVGLSIGLNYLQLFAGYRFDRKEEVTQTVENGIPTGVETTADKWTHTFTWGLNIPVGTVTKLLTKK